MMTVFAAVDWALGRTDSVVFTAAQKGAYRARSGSCMDRHGNRVARNSASGHIPLWQYVFIRK